MNIKKLSFRITSGFLAFIISFITLFYVYSIPAEAAEAALIYDVVNWTESNPQISQFIAKALIYAGLGGAVAGGVLSDTGADAVAINQQTAEQIVSDFAGQINSGELENKIVDFLVINPAETAKQIFIDNPAAAIDNLLDSTGCGVALVSRSWEDALSNADDAYLYISDSFCEALDSFLAEHIIDNVYYTDPPNYEAEPWDGSNPKKSIIPKYHIVQYWNGSLWRTVWGTNTSYISNVCGYYQSGTLILAQYKNNDMPGIDHNFKYKLANSTNYDTARNQTFSGVKSITCNFPIFSTRDAALSAFRNNDFSDAINLPDVAELAPDVIWPVDLTAEQAISVPDVIWNIHELEGVLEGLQEKVDELVGELAGDIVIPGEQTGAIEWPIDHPIPVELPGTIPIPIPWTRPYPWEETIPIDDPTNPDDPIPPGPSDPDDPNIPGDYGGGFFFDLSGFFPFCLPMDLYLAMKILQEDPAPPVFLIPVDIQNVTGETIHHDFEINIVQPAGENSGSAEPFVVYFRWFLTFLFIVFLIFATIKITPH